MAKGYEEIAQCASMLGILFYYDPLDEKSEPILNLLVDDETNISETWPYGQPQSGVYLDQMAEALRTRSMQDIHKAYNRLFIGPYRLPAPPWGSVYTDPESVIFGNETLAVRRWMRSNCVIMKLDEKEPEDHFGLILLMLSWAVTNDLPDEAIDELLQEHLLPWSGRFLELFIDGCEDDYYMALGQLARLTLDDWKDRFDLIPAERLLSR